MENTVLTAPANVVEIPRVLHHIVGRDHLHTQALGLRIRFGFSR